MTALREPSARDEKQISEHAAHFGALLDAAREAGLSGYSAYNWDDDRPAEPCLVVADVHVYAEGVEEPEFVIDRARRISVTRIDLALRANRATVEQWRTARP